MKICELISLKKCVTLFLCCGIVTGYAQVDTLQCYPESIRLDLNTISGNNQALNAFFQQLDSLRSEAPSTVSIVQLGDSHIQAGFYPAVLRNHFQRDFGNAGRGLIVPLKLSGTNEPPDYTITSPNAWSSNNCVTPAAKDIVGISGISLATADTSIELHIKTQDTFDRIWVFHHPQAPLLTVPDSLDSGIGCPAMDSNDMTLIPLSQATHQVALRAHLTDTAFTYPAFYGFSLENGHNGVLYHSIGINGNTFSAVNRHPQIIRQAAMLHPSLVILSLGTNDSYTYRFDASEVDAQMTQLIQLIRQYMPTSILLLTTPMECCRRGRSRGRTVQVPNPNSGLMRDQILALAARNDLPVWDFYAIAGGEEAMSSWNRCGMAQSDQVHLSREGYTLQGELFYQAIRQAYQTYQNNTTGGISE